MSSSKKRSKIHIAALLTSYVLIAAAIFLLVFYYNLWAVLALLLIAALIIMLWHTPFSDQTKIHAMYGASVVAIFIIAVAVPDGKETALFFSWGILITCFALYEYMSLVYIVVADFAILHYLYFYRSTEFLLTYVYLTFLILLLAAILKRYQRQSYEKQEQMKQELCCKSKLDPLTSLPNRLFFMEYLTQAIERVESHESVAVIFFDFDEFKQINDTAGHGVGDQLLIRASERISNRLKNELLARYGGDEFVVLIPRVSHLQEINVVMQNIKDSFEEAYVIGGSNYKISACMGISVYPADTQDPQEMIFIADMAMLKAKKERRISLAERSKA